MLDGTKERVRGWVRRLGLDVVGYPRWNTAPWALHHLLPRLGITCVLDVGGHHGEYGQLLREVGYRGEIVSFEPVPESFAILSERCARDPRWRAYPYALGAEEGELPIHVTAQDVFTSFLQPDEAAAGRFVTSVEIARTDTVPVRRLDRVLDECVAPARDPVLFLKTDTQGYDFHVVEGAGERIREMRGLQMELAVRPLYHGVRQLPEALAELDRLGFDLFGLFPVVHDEELRVLEFDCIAQRS